MSARRPAQIAAAYGAAKPKLFPQQRQLSPDVRILSVKLSFKLSVYHVIFLITNDLQQDALSKTISTVMIFSC
jgi:hypothetical protein